VSDTPPAPALAPPHPQRRSLSWWLPGVIVGTLAACATLAVLKLGAPAQDPAPNAAKSPPPPQYSHRAEVFVQLPSNEPEAKRRQRMVLLRSPDLLTRVLKCPAVTGRPSVLARENPIDDIAARLAVAEVGPELISVSMTGNDPEDMKVILEELAKLFVDDEVAFERRALYDSIKKHEQFADALRIEIESVEKQIELLARASGSAGGADNAQRIAELQKRYIEADAEYNRVNREIVRLEAELVVLKKQLADPNSKEPPDQRLVDDVVKKDPRVIKAKTAFDTAKTAYESAHKAAGADPKAPAVIELKGELDKRQKEYDEAKNAATDGATLMARALDAASKKARVARLNEQIEIKKTEREKLGTERDGLKKLIDAGVGGGLIIESMRKRLQAQNDALDKINAELTKLHLATRVGGLLAVRGAATVAPVPVRDEAPAEPTPRRTDRAATIGLPVAAFAIGFVLATGFSLVGLVFRVLRRHA
jgi:hypothetical protein